MGLFSMASHAHPRSAAFATAQHELLGYRWASGSRFEGAMVLDGLLGVARKLSSQRCVICRGKGGQYVLLFGPTKNIKT